MYIRNIEKYKNLAVIMSTNCARKCTTCMIYTVRRYEYLESAKYYWPSDLREFCDKTGKNSFNLGFNEVFSVLVGYTYEYWDGLILFLRMYLRLAINHLRILCILAYRLIGDINLTVSRVTRVRHIKVFMRHGP